MALARVHTARAFTRCDTRCVDARRARYRARAGVKTRAQGVVELASALDAVNLDLALSDAEEFLGKGAFAALSAASLAFGGKVRVDVRREGVDAWVGRGWGAGGTRTRDAGVIPKRARRDSMERRVRRECGAVTDAWGCA